MAVRAIGTTATLTATATSFSDKSFLPKSKQQKTHKHHPVVNALHNSQSSHSAVFWKKPQLFSVFLPALTLADSSEALTKEDVLDALTKAEDAYAKAQGVASTAYGITKDFIDQVLKVVSPAMDAAMPYVQKATDSAMKMASPVASDVTQQAQKALESAGVDPTPVVEVAKNAVVVAGKAAEQTSKTIEEAKPLASATIDTLVSSDPIVLLEGAGVLILLYLLVPRLLATIAYSVRGYKGDLTPPQALELLTKQDYVMIDVRSEKEKAKAGIPSLPRNAKNRISYVPVEEFSNKLRGLLKNSRKVEAEIAALKISYLKRLNKGSKIVIMDSYGDVAKIVARALTGFGFKNTWVLNDGFSGGRGWLQSCLGTDSYGSPFAGILSPSRILSAGRGTGAGTRRLLASGD